MLKRLRETRYGLPIVLPIVVGTVTAFANLPADVGQTVFKYRQDVQKIEDFEERLDFDQKTDQERSEIEGRIAALRKKVRSYYFPRNIISDLASLLKSISEGVAASVISVDIWAFTVIYSTYASRKKTDPPYMYPVIGMIVHFILLLFIVSVGQLTVYSKWVALISIATMIVAIITSVVVRNGVWEYEKDVTKGLARNK